MTNEIPPLLHQIPCLVSHLRVSNSLLKYPLRYLRTHTQRIHRIILAAVRVDLLVLRRHLMQETRGGDLEAETTTAV